MNSANFQRDIHHMTLRGAIFDADGVLLDSMHIWRELGARYLEGLGIQPEEGLSQRLYPMSLEQSCRYLKTRYNLSFSEDEIQSGILGIIEGFYRNEVKLKPGIPEFLSAMKSRGVKIVIATAGDRDLLMSALERNGIAGYFDAIFTCTELNTTKHEPEIFMSCAEFMGLAPENVGVFEDALFAIETAKRAGFITFGVSDESNINDRTRIKELADYYIEDFRGGI